MTQTEVAAAAGLTRETYNKLETGSRQMSHHYAAMLEKVYGPDVWATVPRPQALAAPGREATPPSSLVLLEALQDQLADEIARFDLAVGGILRRLDALEEDRRTRAHRAGRRRDDKT